MKLGAILDSHPSLTALCEVRLQENTEKGMILFQNYLQLC